MVLRNLDSELHESMLRHHWDLDWAVDGEGLSLALADPGKVLVCSETMRVRQSWGLEKTQNYYVWFLLVLNSGVDEDSVLNWDRQIGGRYLR